MHAKYEAFVTYDSKVMVKVKVDTDRQSQTRETLAAPKFHSRGIKIMSVYIIPITMSLIALFVYTVNVVIFAGGKFRENVGKTFHVGVIFTILLLFPS